MSSSLLSIGTQALNANSSALAYTGQNISNVNTEGYSRQRISFATQEPPILGVAIQDIERITDQFLEEQVRRDQSALSSSEQQYRKIELLDKLMISETTNLSEAMDSYFAALQGMVDDPLFIANRQLFLAEASSLVSTFQNFDSRLEEQLAAITEESRSIVSSINAITNNLANLNVKIGSLASSGQNYNALLDDRAQLMKDLARYVSVDVVSSDGGITQTVVLASGEPLVSSGTAVKLVVADGNPNPSQIQIKLLRGSTASDVTGLLGEGELGGLFAYRDEILQPTRNEIGRLGMVFIESMNEQHREGIDLNGLMGQDLFSSVLEGQFFAKSTNQTLTLPESELTYYNLSELSASDYEVEITGLNTFRIKRLSDGEIFDSEKMAQRDSAGSARESVPAQGAVYSDPSSNTFTVSLDGFTLKLSTADTPQKGDLFLLQPTATGARNIALAITNPASLALASPLRVTPAPENDGNLELESIEVLDGSVASALRPGQLDRPVEIVFNTPVDGDYTFSVYDNSDPSNPSLIADMENLRYTSGEPITFTDLDGNDLYQITLRNFPRAGDRFQIEYNAGGVSDNTNALAMANLQQVEAVNGFSYQNAYGQLLAKVGTQANVVRVSYMANQSILSSSEGALESVRGVNLDEEAANLVKYQQAYTASTRLISTYQTIFDSLLSAVR